LEVAFGTLSTLNFFTWFTPVYPEAAFWRKFSERSEAPLRTAFFRMVAELNDLPEVTGAAEWRFRNN